MKTSNKLLLAAYIIIVLAVASALIGARTAADRVLERTLSSYSSIEMPAERNNDQAAI
ncbi:MAG: hypothetical protein ACQEQU_05870 [Spirochaetota bacterium]